ncbi:hypothetical protein KA996_08685 [bacterium]|nr:hypothetical protein [bacterium]
MIKKNPAGSGNFLPVTNSKTCPVVAEFMTEEFYHETLLKSRYFTNFN